MQIIGLDHIHIAMPIGEEAKARQLYGDLLGLCEMAKPELLAARGGCWFEGPGAQIHLGVQVDFVPARKAHPAFRVTDLEALRQKLEAANMPVQPDDSNPHLRRFYTHDPFGNRLEFIQEGDSFDNSRETE